MLVLCFPAASLVSVLESEPVWRVRLYSAISSLSVHEDHSSDLTVQLTRQLIKIKKLKRIGGQKCREDGQGSDEMKIRCAKRKGTGRGEQVWKKKSE